MSGVSKFKFHVIRFLEETYKDTPDSVCVPRSWIQSKADDEKDPLVNVWYPDEDLKYTEKRVRKRKEKSIQWKSFLSIIKFSTDSYEEAKSYVCKEINQEEKQEDHTRLAEKAKGETSNFTQATTSNAKTDDDAFVVSMLDAMGWCVSSKSTNTLTVKRKEMQEPDKEAHNKPSTVIELVEPDDQVAGPSKRAFKYKENHLSLAHEVSDKETPVENPNDENSLKNRKSINKNPSGNYSLDPEMSAQLSQLPMFPKLCVLILELQKVMGNAMLKELLHKLLNTDNSFCSNNNYPIESAQTDVTAEAPKLIQGKRNGEVEKYIDDDFGPINKKSFPDRTNQEVVPSGEYNGNDSKKYNTDDYYHGDTLQRKSCPKRFKKVNSPPEYVANKLKEENNMSVESLRRKSCPKRFKNFILSPGFVVNGSGEKNIDNDFKESDKTKNFPKRAKTVVLPPNYDANDSKWTLKYRELKPGLVELMNGTGVFVRAVQLSQFQRLSKDGKQFAQKLLSEIFKTSALRTCSWTGARARAYDRNGTNVRPGLDRNARTVLLRYASDYAREQAWPYSDTPAIKHSIRNKLQKMRP